MDITVIELESGKWKAACDCEEITLIEMALGDSREEALEKLHLRLEMQRDFLESYLNRLETFSEHPAQRASPEAEKGIPVKP